MGIVFAVVKNGMWDDPASANTGTIAAELASRAADAGYRAGCIEPYLTWRLCYSMCACLFGIAKLCLNWPGVSGGGESKYGRFLRAQLPQQVSSARFDPLVDILAYEELAVWSTALISVCLLGVATLFARPSIAIARIILARRILWISWLAAFLPPFILFLVFPLRSAADWEGLTADMCINSVKAVIDKPGTSLRQILLMSTRADFKRAVEDTETWCAERGADWHKHFFGVSVKCAWSFEDQCHYEVCFRMGRGPMADNTAMMACILSCFSYLDTAVTAECYDASNQYGAEFAKDRYKVTCDEAGTYFLRGVMDTWMRNCTDDSLELGVGKVQQDWSGNANANGEPDLLPLYRQVVETQRLVVVQASKAIVLASVHAEHVVGTLIALIAGKYLVPRAISLLGGLAESLLNCKAMFTASQHGAWILILTTAEVVPVYAALLGMTQQIFGDRYLAGACIAKIIYSMLGILTGFRLLGTRHGVEEREGMYVKVWVEYGLRAICLTCILAFLITWANLKHDGLRRYVQNELITPEVIVSVVVDMVSNKILTAIAGTDVVLVGFVQTERWYGELSRADKLNHDADVRDMAWLGADADPVKASEGAEQGDYPQPGQGWGQGWHGDRE